MLIHLIRSGAASVPVSDLRPDPNAMIQHRLDRMVTAGFIDFTPEGYRLTPKGRRVSGFFRAVKAFWKLGPGG
jgi:hypothetical protein